MKIETETDIEHLRQMALLLEAANEKLCRRITELKRELASLKGKEGENLELEIELLKEELSAQRRALYGRSSERRVLGEGKGPAEEREVHCGHGPREQRDLPIVEQVHELDEADRICPQCGGELREWEGQFERAEEVDVVERSFKLVIHRRQKYRCECGSSIETALGPPKLIAGGRYSIGFATEVVIAKYCDHVPLARQVKQMARAGLRIDTQTLWDQLFALSRHLEPTYEALHDYVLSYPVIGADETTWRLMEKKKSRKWWAWSVVRPDAVCYRVLPSRSADAAREVLKDYRGCVMADGYGAYGALKRQCDNGRDGPRFELANCWAHVRRKFIEAEEHYPQAREGLEKIEKLYEIEARARERNGPGRLSYLAELRRKESCLIVGDIRKWMLSQGALPRSSLGKAIGYTLDLWPGLCRFLDNPAIPIDNNQTERGMRAVAVGRKNHYGSRSIRGTRVAGLFYSLIESAKLSGLEPAAYLKEATRRAIASPGTVTLPRDLVTP